jgi:hypothetical protein
MNTNIAYGYMSLNSNTQNTTNINSGIPFIINNEVITNSNSVFSYY